MSFNPTITKKTNKKIFEEKLINAIYELKKNEPVYLSNCFIGYDIIKEANILSNKYGLLIHNKKVYFYILGNFYYVVSFIQNDSLLLKNNFKNNKIKYDKNDLLNIKYIVNNYDNILNMEKELCNMIDEY